VDQQPGPVRSSWLAVLLRVALVVAVAQRRLAPSSSATTSTVDGVLPSKIGAAGRTAPVTATAFVHRNGVT
jgi:hypothetical protein